MITQLQVRNWKSFQEAKLYLDPLTILIGTNSSGKSNLLEAFLFLSWIAKGARFEDVFKVRDRPTGLRGTATTLVNLNSSREDFTLTVLFDHSLSKTSYRYTIACEVAEEGSIKLQSESLERRSSRQDHESFYYLFKTGDRDEENLDIQFRRGSDLKFIAFLNVPPGKSVLQRLAGSDLDREVIEGVVRVITTLSKVAVVDPLPPNMRSYSAVSSVLLPDCSNVAGVLAKLPPDKLKNAQKILTEYIDLLSEKDINWVWTQTVEPLNKDAMLYIEEAWPQRTATTIDAESASDGTLHLLGVMVAILTAEPESLIVIEEVDKGLHPSRTNLLVKFLNDVGRERRLDIVCTTHNPALLDAFGNEMIAFMSIVHRNEQTGMSEVSLVEDINQLPRILAKGKIGQLSTMGLLEKALN